MVPMWGPISIPLPKAEKSKQKVVWALRAQRINEMNQTLTNIMKYSMHQAILHVELTGLLQVPMAQLLHSPERVLAEPG